jgi:hypothetical protein
MQGRFESGDGIAALRGFVGLTQAEFARAIAISVHSRRGTRILRENLESAA